MEATTKIPVIMDALITTLPLTLSLKSFEAFNLSGSLHQPVLQNNVLRTESFPSDNTICDAFQCHCVSPYPPKMVN